jgi:tetratricopeptide (TPR) repeat protein
MAYEQKAFSFYQMADYASSIEMADKGMRLSGQMRDTLFDIILLTQKAQSQLALGQTEEAERNVKVTIQALSRKDMPAERLATSYSIYARLLNTRKESREAAGYYKKAFELNLQQKNLSQCTRDLMDLGYLYDKDLHELEKAIGIYQQGITLANRVGDPYMVAGLYNNLGVACWRRQRFRLTFHG